MPATAGTSRLGAPPPNHALTEMDTAFAGMAPTVRVAPTNGRSRTESRPMPEQALPHALARHA